MLSPAILDTSVKDVCDLAIGPYQGKQTGENALLRDMLDAFHRLWVLVAGGPQHLRDGPCLWLLSHRKKTLPFFCG